MTARTIAVLASVIVAFALTACSGSGGRDYDISAIFPATPDKCAAYNGDEEGSGISASCMVSKEECERAASDWSEAMSSSGVNDAILFSCD